MLFHVLPSAFCVNDIKPELFAKLVQLFKNDKLHGIIRGVNKNFSISKYCYFLNNLDMRVSYAPLWRTMKKRGITTYKLIKDYEFNARTVNNLRHDLSITMNTLGKLCEILDCTPNDVVEFFKE